MTTLPGSADVLSEPCRANRWTRVYRWSQWNQWKGGIKGRFNNPQNWSHGRVPNNADCAALNAGCITLPSTLKLNGLALVGPGKISIEGDPANFADPKLWLGGGDVRMVVHPSIGALVVTRPSKTG